MSYENLSVCGVPGLYGPFNDDELLRIDYYLTQPSKTKGVVKLGAKCTLKNGEKYGNIIAIPLAELVRLVANVSGDSTED